MACVPSSVDILGYATAQRQAKRSHDKAEAAHHKQKGRRIAPPPFGMTG
jgi:hypothetical protein